MDTTDSSKILIPIYQTMQHSISEDNDLDTVSYKKANFVMQITNNYTFNIPTDAIPTLSWWWGLSAPETLRAIPAVA
jgi:hypothetical protein